MEIWFVASVHVRGRAPLRAPAARAAWTEKAVGQMFGERYRIDRVLATGGMGLLFAGTDERAERPVAIKLLEQRAVESVVTEGSTRTPPRRTRAAARQARPVSDEPPAAADAGLQVLVEW
jgi:hypothetical protein